jgi:hypothetical protein
MIGYTGTVPGAHTPRSLHFRGPRRGCRERALLLDQVRTLKAKAMNMPNPDVINRSLYQIPPECTPVCTPGRYAPVIRATVQ